MKLDLKELIAKVTKPSYCSPVTVPFTPPCNGLLIVILRASSGGRFYTVFNNLNPTIVDGYNIAQGYIVGIGFVVKGQKVTVNSTSNVSTREYLFIPLVGGVVHNLLNMLTLERGWAV